MPSKTLILTSCCKDKLDVAAPARDLYTGQLFRLVREYAEETGSDWRILSAKHGLVSPDQVLEPYDVQIKGRKQIDPLQATVLPALATIWNNYARIIVIMGSQYLKVINPILKRQGNWKMDPNVIVDVIHDERGIGGLLQRVKDLIKANDAINKAKTQGLHYVGPPIEGCVQTKVYTRERLPDLCKPCLHRESSFDPTRRAGLPNGDDNPASTACDYCCTGDDGIPDHLPCSQCGAGGDLRRLKHAIVCDACHKVHQQLGNHLDGNQRARKTHKLEADVSVKTDEDGKTRWCVLWWSKDAYGPGGAFSVMPGQVGELFQILRFHANGAKCELGEVYNLTEGKTMPEQPKPDEKKDETKEPEPSEFGRICGGCGKPIKPGSKNMVRDHQTGRWFHAEHYAMDERHQETEDRYECIACSKEFPEGEMHEDRDGERWCKPCWAAEHPRKKREKPAKPVPEQTLPATSKLVPVCSQCNLPQTEEIYLPSTGFKRCTCKTTTNRTWAGVYLYNKIFAKHFKEIKALLDKDEREQMNVLGSVLE